MAQTSEPRQAARISHQFIPPRAPPGLLASRATVDHRGEVTAMAQPMRDDPEPERGPDLCPHCGFDRRPLDDILAEMTPDNPAYQRKSADWDAWHKADMARTGRYPTIEDYRKVYRSLERDGVEWPGDEEIYRRYDGLIAT